MNLYKKILLITTNPIEATQIIIHRLNHWYWGKCMDSKRIKHGQAFTFIQPVYLNAPGTGTIQFGDKLSLNHNVTIDAGGGGKIHIGDGVQIGMNSVLRASNHDYVKGEGHIRGHIYVGNNVWIGANCVVLPNVILGTGCVIGAGSIVTKDMPAGWVCFGNPCMKRWEIKRCV